MILDASVVVAALLPDEALSDRALAVVEDVLSRPTGSLVPTPCWFEVAHALVRAVRRGRLPVASHEATQKSLAGLIFHIASRDVGAVECLRIALDLRLSAYDSAYLALSRTTGQPIITADRRLFEVGTRAGYDLVWLGDLPGDGPGSLRGQSAQT